MGIAKIVESQRPALRETTLTGVEVRPDVKCDRLDSDFQLHRVANTLLIAASPPEPLASRPCSLTPRALAGSSLEHKRCCGNPVTARAA